MSRHVQDYLPEIDFFFETSCESDMQREMHMNLTRSVESSDARVTVCTYRSLPTMPSAKLPFKHCLCIEHQFAVLKISSGDLCLKMKITLLTFRVNQSKQQLVPRRVLESTNSASLIFTVAQAEIHMFTIFQCSS